MKVINQFSLLFFVVIFLTSCKSSINQENSIIDSEENFNKNSTSEKEKNGNKVFLWR